MSTNTALDDIKARTEGHTEGPWAWAGTPARRELSGKGGDVLACATLLWPDTADAELTAAAPKLLAALEAVEALHVPVLEDGKPVGCRVCDWGEDDYYPCQTLTAIEEALR